MEVFVRQLFQELSEPYKRVKRTKQITVQVSSFQRQTYSEEQPYQSEGTCHDNTYSYAESCQRCGPHGNAKALFLETGSCIHGWMNCSLYASRGSEQDSGTKHSSKFQLKGSSWTWCSCQNILLQQAEPLTSDLHECALSFIACSLSHVKLRVHESHISVHFRKVQRLSLSLTVSAG